MSINCVHILLDLLFKHITNVSFKKRFDVLKIFRFVTSKYRRVTKMQLVLFALFINTIFKEDTWQVYSTKLIYDYLAKSGGRT